MSDPSETRTTVTPRIVWLVGLMGAGKTTVGRLVAERLGWPFVDNDAELLAAEGRTAAEIGEHDGAAVLHHLEWQRVAKVSRRPPPLVAAVSASVADSQEMLELLDRSGVVVYIRVEVSTLARRIRHTEHRPWVDADIEALLTSMAKTRDPAYRGIADLVVPSSDGRPEMIADRVVEWLRGPVDLT